MDNIRVVSSLLLIIGLVGAKCSENPKQKPQTRIDSYDDILKPPPPPPPNFKYVFPNVNQRHQRQPVNQYRQPQYLRYMHQEKPIPINWQKPEEPTMLQKFSNWLFPAASEDTHASGTQHLNHGQPSISLQSSSSYSLPVTSQSKDKKNCNLCNQFPWVPVIKYQPIPQNPVNHERPSKLLQPPQNDIYHSGIIENQSNNLVKQIVVNSYGNPISPTVYNSDMGESDFQKHLNKDSIDNLETNNVPFLSKPHHAFNNNSSKQPMSETNFNKGKNIHVLQPIPFPNLSPSPVPPIYNARPFLNINNNKHVLETMSSTTQISTLQRPNSYQSSLPTSIINSIISNTPSKNFHLVPSIPLAEFTSSIDYPISIIQSPLVDIEVTDDNHNKGDNVGDSNNINFNKNPIIVENETSISDTLITPSEGNNYKSDHQSINSDTIRNRPPFLPTPIPIADSRKPNLSPISYSYIDQTFSVGNEQFPTSSSHLNNKIYKTNVNKQTESGDNSKPITSELLISDSPLLYLKPNVPHKESTPFKHVVEDETYKSSTEKNIGTTTLSTQLSRPSNNVFRYLENNVVEGKWPPPDEAYNLKINQPTTKPKRIQIIIPYTTKNQPSPFKFSRNNVNPQSDWIPLTNNIDKNYGRRIPSLLGDNEANSNFTLVDYHESSESKIITYNDTITTTKPKRPKPTDLLEPIKNRISFDAKRLHQNIDEWTALEYSKIFKRQQKASTTSSFKRSKKIPDEYLTTTPFYKQTTRPFLSNINEINISLLDNDNAYSTRVETNAHNDASVPHDSYSNTIKSYNHNNLESTTISPRTTTKAAWETVQTSISPLTKEKVYVVTPQPWHIVNSSFTFDSSLNNSTIEKNSDKHLQNLSFKSPRFLVRPTPGTTASQKDYATVNDKQNAWKASFNWLQSINNLEEITTESKPRNIFDLSAVTAYTPPDGSSVHTYSGHSRVVTAVTTSSVINS